MLINNKNLVFLFIYSCFIFICGAVFQRYYGLGNVVNFIYPYYTHEEQKNYIKNNHQGEIEIFLMAGQSNMVGDGNEKIDKLNDGKIYVFNNDFQWVEGKEPVRSKVGPSMAIALEISNSTKNPIGIINVAKGNTNISEWQRSKDDNSLYQNLLKRAFASQSQGEIKGLFFLQGEADAQDSSNGEVENWHVLFEKFITDLRYDLKNDSLKIVFGQIGKGSDSRWKKVKESQKKVNLKNVVMIKTDGITPSSDGVHYDSDGYKKIGQKFGKAYVSNFIN